MSRSEAAPWVVIADPESKRWEHYRDAVRCFAKRARIDLRLVPWEDVIAREGNLAALPELSEARPTMLRIESPGRRFEVTRRFLALGARLAGEKNPRRFLTTPFSKGRLIRPGLLYLGLKTVLQEMDRSTRQIPYLQMSASGEDIAGMFDKNLTSRRLEQAGIPTPQRIDTRGGTSELLLRIQQQEKCAYIKLAHGSSASGMVAVFNTPQGMFGMTTMASIEGHFYNTRRIVRVEGNELGRRVDFLLAEGACAQRGIPMARVDGCNFDVRVVVIHGSPEFTVFRTSAYPMTNLHLGGRRGDPQECLQVVPKRKWLDALDHCVEAASLFRSDVVGVDLLFERGCFRHYILELNAFGDFFPGHRNSVGQSVHEREIELTWNRFRPEAAMIAARGESPHA